MSPSQAGFKGNRAPCNLRYQHSADVYVNDRPLSPPCIADQRLHSIVQSIPICSSQTYTRRLVTPGEIFVHRAYAASWLLTLLMASVTLCAGKTRMVVLAESALEQKPPAASDLARQEVEGEHLETICCIFLIWQCQPHAQGCDACRSQHDMTLGGNAAYFFDNINNVCLEQMVKMRRPVDSAYL